MREKVAVFFQWRGEWQYRFASNSGMVSEVGAASACPNRANKSTVLLHLALNGTAIQHLGYSTQFGGYLDGIVNLKFGSRVWPHELALDHQMD